MRFNTKFETQINMLENINKCDNSGDFAPLFSLDIKFVNISHKTTENFYATILCNEFIVD